MKILSCSRVFATALILTTVLQSQITPVYAEHSILIDFLGEWQSDDDAFGKPARSTATWARVLDDKFIRLDYVISRGLEESEKPVFAGVAYYKQLEAGAFTAFWSDTAGDLHPITGKQTDRSLESTWGSTDGKPGRTRYELVDSDHMIITDWIMKDGEWREFNRGTFTRQSSGANTAPTRNVVTGSTQYQREGNMEKALGIGGVFFRAANSQEVAQWYFENLGIELTPTDYDTHPWQQEAGPTVFAPFNQNTDYFGKPDQQWMINFRVRNLDAIVEQLRSSGNEVVVDPQTYPNGRFARTHDPEGTPIELWQPAE